ncbi:19395_t:CDS:2 [Entrophospora sp. SA101]|nr:15353_t:CDS:2 [Entrophospora candida]CAH1762035.1 5564_t:CDS:2 [Entrophospora sp. SA101]CAJ0637796.1 6604_t:CDS:2 [Entrophospora sp. SA101]CAJ0753789.1 19395_t:CDS:2 [Entrophospora sp. SA101]CAJ0863627.1 12281_t:CDS:2 [Entrophospora sp. SA101]
MFRFLPSKVFTTISNKIVKKKTFNVLGIETSCDDTAVAIVNSDRQIISEAIHLQQHLHEPNGGIVPNLAMASHQQNLPLVVREALDKSNLDLIRDIDVIAVTRGPGLPACLGIGLSAAKTLAAALWKPLIGVHHMEAHALTARLTSPGSELLQFPFLTLLISGGHTLILVTHNVNQYTQLGTTLDDSIGEAFDKTSRLLGIPWVKGRRGGPGAALEQLALEGDPKKYSVTIPMRGERQRYSMDMSFSGLKTAINNLITKYDLDLNDSIIKKDLAITFQQTAIKHLTDKMELAFQWCKKNNISLTSLVVSGGVASNKNIRESLQLLATQKHNVQLICPPPHLCTDNGVMVAWAGVERFREGLVDEYTIDHMPRWPITSLGSSTKYL